VPTAEELYHSRRKELLEPALLLEEVRAAGWRATAKKHGVCDATIRKWLRKAGLVPQAQSQGKDEGSAA
jgi:transposase-like protein